MVCPECSKEHTKAKFCSQSCSAKFNNRTRPSCQLKGSCFTCGKIQSTSIKYCPDCREIHYKSLTKNICNICGVNKTDENTRKKKSKKEPDKYQAHCKLCDAARQLIYDRDFKKQAVEYKGGSCERCGYSDCFAALDFHHLNPNEKEFSLSKINTGQFTDIIKQELDKCILLCANCHREEHYTQTTDKYQDRIVLYNIYQSQRKESNLTKTAFAELSPNP